MVEGRAGRLSRSEVAVRTAIVVAVVGGMVVLALLLWDLRRLVVWLLIAMVLAVTIEPGVSWLERRRLPRWLGATLITLATVAVVAAIVAAVAVPLATQSRQLLSGLPRLVHDALRPGGMLGFLEQRFHIQERVGTITPGRVFRFVAGPRSVSSMFSEAAALFSAVFTVVAITIMLLIEGPRAWNRFIAALGERGERVDVVGKRMQRSVAGYMAGNLLISTAAALGSLAAMSILRVPYALPLALAVGLFDLIPLIGASLGAVLCALVALSVGWPEAVALIVYFVIYQRAENAWLGPVVYARTVVLSPLIVLLVSLAGAILGGVVGVLLAIPIAGAAQVVIGEILRAGHVGGQADQAAQREHVGDGSSERSSERSSATHRKRSP